MRFFFWRSRRRGADSGRVPKLTLAFEPLEQRALLAASVFASSAPDSFGGVEIQTHYEHPETAEHDSSCWIRTSQPHSSEGVDRPIVVGLIYHAESMPPFGLPGSVVASGWKSNSDPGSGHNETIRIHAQYDMSTTVEHDEAQSVGAIQTVTVGAVRRVT